MRKKETKKSQIVKNNITHFLKPGSATSLKNVLEWVSSKIYGVILFNFEAVHISTNQSKVILNSRYNDTLNFILSSSKTTSVNAKCAILHKLPPSFLRQYILVRNLIAARTLGPYSILYRQILKYLEPEMIGEIKKISVQKSEFERRGSNQNQFIKTRHRVTQTPLMYAIKIIRSLGIGHILQFVPEIQDEPDVFCDLQFLKTGLEENKSWGSSESRRLADTSKDPKIIHCALLEKKYARLAYEDHFAKEVKKNDVEVFPDGSAIKNGCGAGFVNWLVGPGPLQSEGRKKNIQKGCEAVSPFRDISVAELLAFKIGIESIIKKARRIRKSRKKNRKGKKSIKNVHIYTDSLYVFNVFAGRIKPKVHIKLILQTFRQIDILQPMLSGEVILSKIASHVGIEGNDIADKEAAIAARRAAKFCQNKQWSKFKYTVSQKFLLKFVKNKLFEEFYTSQLFLNSDKLWFQCCVKERQSILFADLTKRPRDLLSLRLMLGKSPTCFNFFKWGVLDSPFCPFCLDEPKIHSESHIIFFCRQTEFSRKYFLQGILDTNYLQKKRKKSSS